MEPLLEEVCIPNLAEIDWVIVGGESGNNARPMQKDWVRFIRNQCQVTNTPFFFKQWGEFGDDGKRVGKKVAGRMLDGRVFNEYPTVERQSQQAPQAFIQQGFDL